MADYKYPNKYYDPKGSKTAPTNDPLNSVTSTVGGGPYQRRVISTPADRQALQDKGYTAGSDIELPKRQKQARNRAKARKVK